MMPRGNIYFRNWMSSNLEIVAPISDQHLDDLDNST